MRKPKHFYKWPDPNAPITGRAEIHPNWLDPKWWHDFRLYCDYLDRITAGQKQSV